MNRLIRLSRRVFSTQETVKPIPILSSQAKPSLISILKNTLNTNDDNDDEEKLKRLNVNMLRCYVSIAVLGTIVFFSTKNQETLKEEFDQMKDGVDNLVGVLERRFVILDERISVLEKNQKEQLNLLKKD